MASLIDLSTFENADYDPGGGSLPRVLWFFAGLPLLRSAILPFSGFRVSLLRAFGAKIGKAAVIKPGVRVKYPWRLTVGDNCWIGEDVWIDNLADVTIGDNVCISQGAYLCTGNHDWSDPSFGLITKPIRIATGAWIAARACLGPGASMSEYSVIGFGSVLLGRIPSFEIHTGNPAVFQRNRSIAAANQASGKEVS